MRSDRTAQACPRLRNDRGAMMNTTLLLVQALNGLQFGLILFLIAAGLTLVFGVMDFINLAHGVQYMVGAYLAACFTALTGSFGLGLLLALPAALAFGLFLEVLVFRHLYDRDHLDQVLATFGVILFLNQGVKFVWGAAPLNVPVPDALSGSIELMDGLLYPVYRLAIIARASRSPWLYGLVNHTRIGMLVRAGATNAPDGVGARRRHPAALHGGVRLRRHAGGLRGRHGGADPVGRARHGRQHPDPGLRGDRDRRHRLDPRRLPRGAPDRPRRHAGPLLRADLLRARPRPATASQTGRAIAPMLIYLLMAAVLFFRPAGLFPPRRRDR